MGWRRRGRLALQNSAIVPVHVAAIEEYSSLQCEAHPRVLEFQLCWEGQSQPMIALGNIRNYLNRARSRSRKECSCCSRDSCQANLAPSRRPLSTHSKLHQKGPWYNHREGNRTDKLGAEDSARVHSVVEFRHAAQELPRISSQ
jgi:hypothetical protein